MCTVHISQIFPLNTGAFFQGHWTHISHSPPPPTVLGGLGSGILYTVGKLSSQSTYIPRVTQCLFPRPIWDLPPTPSPARECILPFRTDVRLCVRGVPFPTTGENEWHSVYVVVGKHWLEHTFYVHKKYIRCWLTVKPTVCPLKYTKEDDRIGK